MYDAGQAMIQVIPSLRGFVDTINREAERAGMVAGRTFSAEFNKAVRSRTNGVNLGPSTSSTTRQGQQAGRTFADSFKARVEAALRSLPDIQINADSTAAEVRIARLRTNLEQLRDQRVGIDITSEMALASIENIKRQLDELRAASPDVAVQVDTLHASEELARIQAEIDALHGDDVQVNVDDGGSADKTSRSVSALGIALVSLIPLAAPVGAALAGAFAGALSIVGALGAAIGTVGLAGMDVPKASQLLDQQQTARRQQQAQSPNNAIQMARAQRALGDAQYQAGQQAITSAEQVQRARQSLADTQRQAARQQAADAQAVADAERQLGQADQQVTIAQQNLNAAREQAKRDLVDLRNAAKDANLSQKQAQIDLANAQANLQATDANWTSTAEQRRQAALDVAKAHQALTEANINSQRATQDNNKAQKAGVNGQPGVIAAQRQLAAAIAAQRQATEQLHQAQVKQRQDAADSARSIARAQMAVSDALRQQASQARTSREQILNAQESIQEAMQGTGTTGANSLAEIDKKLAALPPAVVKFARFWKSTMDPIFDRLKNQAASGLFPGIERGLKIMQPLFGPLGRFLHTMGQTVGTLFTQMARALTGPAWTRLFKLFSAEAPRWLMEFGHIVGNSILGIVQLLQAFSPITDMIGAGLVRITKRFAEWTSGLSKNKGFQAFIGYIKTNGPILLDTLGHVVQIVGKLLVGLAPLGHVLLVVIDAVAGFLAKLDPDTLLEIAYAIGAVIFAFNPFLGIAIMVTSVVAIIVRHWSSIVGFFKDIWDAVTGFFDAAWTDIKNGFDTAWRWVKHTFSAVWHGLVAVVVGPFEAALAWVKRYFWTPLKDAFTTAWRWVKNTFAAIWHGIYDVLVHPFEVVWSWLGQHFWTPVKNGFLGAWHWVSNTFSAIWHGLLDILEWPLDRFTRGIVRIWDDIKTGFTKGINGVKTAAKAAWGLIEKIFESPVYYVVKYAYQDGIRALWNTVVDHIGLKRLDLPSLSGFLGHLQHFATGGIFPGYTPGRDTGLIAVGGGEAIMRPEWTRAVGPDYVESANAAARTGGESGVRRFLGGFAGGGVVGALGSFGHGLGSVLNTLNPVHLWNWVKDHFAKLADIVGRLTADIGHSPLARAMVKLPLTLIEKIPGFLKDKITSLVSNPATGLLPFLNSISPPQTLQPGTNYLNANQKLGMAMASAMGWTDAQNKSDLVSLWNKESGWSQFADTRVSGLDPANASVFAYGIAQARPAEKYPLAGRPADLGGRSDPATQIAWGLNYIKSVYGSPAGAWAHEMAFNWYDQGGLLEPGFTLAYNGTGQAELVAPRETFDQVMGGAGNGGRVTGKLDIGADSQGRLYAEIDARIDDRAGFADAIGRTGP